MSSTKPTASTEFAEVVQNLKLVASSKDCNVVVLIYKNPTPLKLKVHDKSMNLAAKDIIFINSDDEEEEEEEFIKKRKVEQSTDTDPKDKDPPKTGGEDGEKQAKDVTQKPPSDGTKKSKTKKPLTDVESTDDEKTDDETTDEEDISPPSTPPRTTYAQKVIPYLNKRLGEAYSYGNISIERVMTKIILTKNSDIGLQEIVKSVVNNESNDIFIEKYNNFRERANIFWNMTYVWMFRNFNVANLGGKLTINNLQTLFSIDNEEKIKSDLIRGCVLYYYPSLIFMDPLNCSKNLGSSINKAFPIIYDENNGLPKQMRMPSIWNRLSELNNYEGEKSEVYYEQFKYYSETICDHCNDMLTPLEENFCINCQKIKIHVNCVVQKVTKQKYGPRAFYECENCNKNSQEQKKDKKRSTRH